MSLFQSFFTTMLWCACILLISSLACAMVLKDPRHHHNDKNRNHYRGDSHGKSTDNNNNDFGRLRMQPTPTSTASSRYFTEVGELPPLASIRGTTTGSHSSCGRRSDKSPLSFGSNDTNQLILPYTDSLDDEIMSAIGGGAGELLQSTVVPVTYTNDPKTVYEWFTNNLPYTGCTVGFDVEFVPRLPWFKDSAFQGPATVQLATSESCLVVHLVRPSGRRSQACAPILKAVLCDESFVKAGCALDDDLLALFDIWDGLDARSRLDLGGIGAETSSFADSSSTIRTANQRRGLKTLSQTILGVDLPKSKTQAISDWSAVPLTESQIMYSARDAWAGAAIVEKLAEYDPETFDTANLVNLLSNSETPIHQLVQRKKQRDRAKADLRRILNFYSEKTNLSSNKISKSSTRNGKPKNEMKSRVELPGSALDKVRLLRREIKTRKMDHPLVFDVDHLGFDFEDGQKNIYRP